MLTKLLSMAYFRKANTKIIGSCVNDEFSQKRYPCYSSVFSLADYRTISPI